MKWTVEGADEKTGVDVTVSYEAGSLEDAMDLARANGILPSDAYLAGSRRGKPAPPLSYATPGTPNVSPAVPPVPPAAPIPALPAAPVVPEYKAIRDGAKWLGTLAAILYVLAVLCFIGSALTAATPDRSIDLLVRGFWLMVGGAVIRMLAHVALAVRDIARNSWR